MIVSSLEGTDRMDCLLILTYDGAFFSLFLFIVLPLKKNTVKLNARTS